MKKLLVISPHPDDEVLGAGGLLVKAKKNGFKTKVLTLSTNFPEPITKERLEISLKESTKAHRILKVDKSVYFNIPTLTFSRQNIPNLTSRISKEISNFKPDIVIIPFPDRHQDHKIVFDLSMTVTRPKGVSKNIKIVACMEIPSATYYSAPSVEPNFYPNWNIDISGTIKQKAKALTEYRSTLSKTESARSTKSIYSLASFRGSQVNLNYAESFYIVRMQSKKNIL
tara:strand:- start:289 stop:969 length:681 start_codon:yes stop_codon:yes gene_type:complete